MEKEYWGIDTEGTHKGTQWEKSDIHSIQICPSTSENKGKVFFNGEDFKKWLRYKQRHRNLPEIFFAFTLPYEYGTLLGWEILKVETEKQKYPFQHWADRPINLFYIYRTKHKRIPVFDIRIFFYQLRYGNNYLTNLEKLGDYLSDYYKEDIHKLPKPLGEEFGKRKPKKHEMEEFKKYGVRDAYITAKGSQWIHENLIDGWLQNKVPITRLYSWGTVAKYYFNLPKLNELKRYGKKYVVEFPNLWHKEIYENTFAGRSEAYSTGNLGQLFYNDVSSLYPVCMIQTQCMLIKDVKVWYGNTEWLLGKINWQKFYEITGYPYGWIKGDFKTKDDLWGLPLKVGNNNLYVTGTLRNVLRNTLDLEASNVEVKNIDSVLIPVYDKGQKKNMSEFENLTMKKLDKKYNSQIEKYCIKSTVNSASGILGKSKPNFGTTTNLPAYNTLLAQSHLNMSRIFHVYHSLDHPVHYTDTDSFFWDRPVNQVLEQLEPYPNLPYQTKESIPLEIGLRSDSWENGTIIFRGKMYYQNKDSVAFSGWKPFPKFFVKIIKEKPEEITVERQVNRKWKTRDKKVTVLRTGRWIIVKEHWPKRKLKHIFRADRKRKRSSYDSYQLFLDDSNIPSRSWNTNEIKQLTEKRKWKAYKEWRIEEYEEDEIEKLTFDLG